MPNSSFLPDLSKLRALLDDILTGSRQPAPVRVPVRSGSGSGPRGGNPSPH